MPNLYHCRPSQNNYKKNGWFSGLERLEMHQKINNEEDNTTVPDTSRINKQKQPNRNEPPTSQNGNATQPNNAQPTKPKQALQQEQTVYLKNLKRIQKSEKTTLPSLKNIEGRTVKTETNKINQTLPYISTNNITEINELIYAGANGVCEKIRIPSKTRMGSSTGNADKKICESRPKWEKKRKTPEYVQTKRKRQQNVKKQQLHLRT